jgi:hypothetical protein
VSGTSIEPGSGVIPVNFGLSWHPSGDTDGTFFIDGTSGTGTLTATTGPDDFVLTSFAAGAHTIAGFNPAQDVIELSMALFPNFSAVQAATTSSGGGSLITLAPSSSLLIQGVAPGSLHASNFVLT